MNNFYIITGAPGSGKTTLLQKLKDKGFVGVYEPARQILEEQRCVNGDGVPEKNAELFMALMLSRSIFQYKQMLNNINPVFFDRGIPDNIGYSSIFNVDPKPAYEAAEKYTYNNIVFVTPDWEEIYHTDEERTISFAEATKFGAELRAIYKRLGYRLVETPKVQLHKRVEFILDTIM